MRIKKLALIVAIALPSVAILSCNSVARESGSVELVVAGTQIINQIDLQSGAIGCATSLGTVNIRILPLQPQNDPAHPVSTQLLDVKLDRYQVSYQRTDGGKLVPPAFVRSTAQVITLSGGSQSLSDFVGFETNALNQAPFAALLPQNGGKDPETGLGFVKLNIILTIFGETLAGDRVQGSATFPINFCYNCGGCF